MLPEYNQEAKDVLTKFFQSHFKNATVELRTENIGFTVYVHSDQGGEKITISSHFLFLDDCFYPCDGNLVPKKDALWYILRDLYGGLGFHVFSTWVDFPPALTPAGNMGEIADNTVFHEECKRKLEQDFVMMRTLAT